MRLLSTGRLGDIAGDHQIEMGTAAILEHGDIGRVLSAGMAAK